MSSNPHQGELVPPVVPDEELSAIQHVESAFIKPVVSRFDAGLTSEFDPNSIQILGEKVARDAFEHKMRIRQELLALPQNETDIDRERLEAYCERIGMPRKATLFLDPPEYERFLKVTGDVNLFTGELMPYFKNSRGYYSIDYDIAAVKRQGATEKLNGPESTESIAIHERAHARNVLYRRSSFPIIKDGKIVEPIDETLPLRRYGFVSDWANDTRTGTILEEGYAEWERGQYIANELHRPNGFYQGDEERYWSDMHRKYLETRTNGHVGYTFVTFAAVAMESLITIDPEIAPLLRQCRDHSELIPELATRIDAIYDGLYEKMTSLEIMGEDDEISAIRLCSRVYDHCKKLRANGEHLDELHTATAQRHTTSPQPDDEQSEQVPQKHRSLPVEAKRWIGNILNKRPLGRLHK